MMNKLQKLKIMLTGLSIALMVATWCQGVEFYVKSDTAKVDILYQSYLVVGFLFLLGILVLVLKSKFDPRKNTFPILSYLFAVISVCFLLLYQPFFDCLRDGGKWDNAKGCVQEKQSN